MDSADEKAPAPELAVPAAPQPLYLKSAAACVTEKASRDTLGSDTLTPSDEKTVEASIDTRRASDVSNPSSNRLDAFDTDIEAIIPHNSAAESCAGKFARRGGTDCQVWPGQDHWKRKAKAAKMKRSCRCLSHLSKRNRLIVKILIGFLVVGMAVGVGFGVSKPLGAGIWQPHDGAN